MKFRFTKGTPYAIPQLDLTKRPPNVEERFDYLYHTAVVDDSKQYMAHPDSVLLKNGSILTVYPEGHGKGPILNKISEDGGRSWGASLANAPQSWRLSRETPTIYRLRFTDGKTADKLILTAGNPKWPNEPTLGGFYSSVSCDEGESWSEFRLFYGDGEENAIRPLVAMASLTQLKENGKFVDKWMGFCHDRKFHNYKTILTFDEEGKEHWSRPERYFSAHRKAERKAQMCEVEVIRSGGGKGDELCLIARSQSKKANSLLSFSKDEGKTWSEPRELPSSLNGERHKADYTRDGRLFITFRSIERGRDRVKRYSAEGKKHPTWYSEGWIAWVGTYEDLVNGREGQYRLKVAHTYLDCQTEPARSANGDTGYCGNVVLEDGTLVTSSYGQFDPKKTYEDQKGKRRYKTCIVSKRIRLEDTDALLKSILSSPGERQ